MKNIFDIFRLAALLLFVYTLSIYGFSLRLIHEKTFDVSPGEVLEVEAYAADVKIDTWDRNEVNVKIYGNRKAEKEIEYSVERTSRGVSVEIEKEHSVWNFWNNIDLEIIVQLPKEFDAYVETSGGDIHLKELKGKGELKTSGGDIDAYQLTGEFEYKTSGGDIEIKYARGKTEASTSGGDVKLIDCSGDALAKTSGGDVNLEVENGSVYGSTSGGDVVLRYKGENKGVELRTSGGDIRVYIPSDFSADADLHSSGGDIDVDIASSRVDKVTSNTYRGSLNGGGKKLFARTSGGDVIVQRN